MRANGAVWALTLILAVPPAALGTSAAWADDPVSPPSRTDVRDARDAVRDQARSVAVVQSELVTANQRLQESAVAAAQAAEAWNGARYRLDQARRDAAAAADRAGIARDDLDTQRQAYTDAIVGSYLTAPELSAAATIVQSDGIGAVIERTTTLQQAESAMDTRYDGFRAASTLAGVAHQQADDAEAAATRLQVEAREAKDAAAAASEAAAAEAESIASRKQGLIRELARLQDVSVRMAERRQSALEAQALADAAAERQQEAAQADPADQATEAPDETTPARPAPAPDPAPEPDPAPQPKPSPAPAPAPPPPPAPSGGVGAAVAFARAQIGEPYQWGAAGPNAWDCSGLTMGAWRSGGKSLPHYSVAQYQQSTRISASNLRAGDLVFWGSSSSSSSIYHVALYIGNGQIIHAPRTGRPVTQESMYYWITPNFYARP